MLKNIYFDNAATTKIDSKVLEEMKPFLDDEYGNPSSIYDIGLRAKYAIKRSREKIAKIIKADSSEIIFTGSGTESDNLAIFGIARANKKFGNHIITSNIEHPAVMESVRKLEQEGFEVTYLSVDKNGLIDINDLEKNIRNNTILISIMYINNEIGSVQPIEKIAKKISTINKERSNAKKNRIYFHSDACQAAGFIKIDVSNIEVDALTINGSKIYGPKGTGFLYLRKNVLIEPIMFGGQQENGKRSGTENVAGIVGLAKAFELAQKNTQKYCEKITDLKSYFASKAQENIDRIVINSNSDKSSSSILSISFLDIEGESALLLLDQKRIFCSTGSACTSNSLKASHVLQAIGLKDEIIHGTLRFSFGKFNSKKEVDFTIQHLVKIIANLRKISPIHI